MQILTTPRDSQQLRLEPATAVTTLVVLLNLLAFIGLSVACGFRAEIDIETLMRLGANDRALGEQAWRLWTCTVLHVDAVAVLTNMWWLIWTGQLVERRIGSPAFLILVLACAAGASGTSAWWNASAVSVGASGVVWGVWGLLGALVVCGQRSKAERQLRGAFLCVIVAVAIDLSTNWLRPQIDTAAHLGGLLTGAVVGVASLGMAAVIHRMVNGTPRRRSPEPAPPMQIDLPNAPMMPTVHIG